MNPAFNRGPVFNRENTVYMRVSRQKGTSSAVLHEPPTLLLNNSPDDTLKASSSLNSKSVFSVFSLLLEIHLCAATIIMPINKVQTMQRATTVPVIDALALLCLGPGMSPEKTIKRD